MTDIELLALSSLALIYDKNPDHQTITEILKRFIEPNRDKHGLDVAESELRHVVKALCEGEYIYEKHQNFFAIRQKGLDCLKEPKNRKRLEFLASGKLTRMKNTFRAFRIWAKSPLGIAIVSGLFVLATTVLSWYLSTYYPSINDSNEIGTASQQNPKPEAIRDAVVNEPPKTNPQMNQQDTVITQPSDSTSHIAP